MPKTLYLVDAAVNSQAAQLTEAKRKIVPVLPIITERMLLKFERGVLLSSLAREFECPPSFVEALIRREIQRTRAELRQRRAA